VEVRRCSGEDETVCRVVGVYGSMAGLGDTDRLDIAAAGDSLMIKDS